MLNAYRKSICMMIQAVSCSSLFILLPINAQSSAREINCPKTITVRETITDKPKGWAVQYGKATPTLDNVTFYDGPPEQMASLVNDEESHSVTKDFAIWHFAPNTEQGYWLECSYRDTNIVIAKRLPPETSRCKVTYSRKKNRKTVVERIECQ